MSAIALYLFQSKNCDRKPHFSPVIKLQGDAQLYRVRVGDYRVVFSIDDREKILTVNRVKHRQDVYE
jgi:mRNA interferase RelE/StbE